MNVKVSSGFGGILSLPVEPVLRERGSMSSLHALVHSPLYTSLHAPAHAPVTVQGDAEALPFGWVARLPHLQNSGLRRWQHLAQQKCLSCGASE